MMRCPDEKLILVEIAFLRIPGINSNFVFCVSINVFISLKPSAAAYSLITAKLPPLSARGQSCYNDFEGEMAHAVRHFGVTGNWLNTVIWRSIID